MIKAYLDKIDKYTDSQTGVNRTLIAGYLGLTLLCFLLLLLPIFHRDGTTLVNHFFMSVSLVSTTGLAPDTFGQVYNLGGQIVGLLMIQLGGLGYMALASFVLIGTRRHLPSLSGKLLKVEFGLPKRYPLFQFIWTVIIFTILIELIGTLCLWYGFAQAGVENPLWNGLFHSISAFCTAGFSLFDSGFEPYVQSHWITGTLTILSIMGSVGFIVILDFVTKITRKGGSMTLTSKIILWATLIILVVGTLLLYFTDPLLRAMPVSEAMPVALFQVMSAHTTVGFNTYDYSQFSLASTVVLLVIMLVGASPAGTGGGVKTTSITALIAVMKSILASRKFISFRGRRIPTNRIFFAVAGFFFYGVIAILGILAVLMIEQENLPLGKVLFECTSALSTVGLSQGTTSILSWGSKLVICALMFIGRIGAITFGLALIRDNVLYDEGYVPEEDVAM